MNQTIDQTRDLLAAADPAPAPVAYSEQRLRAMTRSIVASASHTAQPSPWARARRVAIGLDCQGAAPVRGNRRGGMGERLDVKVVVDQAGRQSQQ